MIFSFLKKSRRKSVPSVTVVDAEVHQLYLNTDAGIGKVWRYKSCDYSRPSRTVTYINERNVEREIGRKYRRKGETRRGFLFWMGAASMIATFLFLMYLAVTNDSMALGIAAVLSPTLWMLAIGAGTLKNGH